ncbi:deoxyribonuclease V [Halomonas binhaiensis]|uniref:Endonuclease V n=1 Tax=Halomonas binhaiensis TaxID=2562282 RepID=A0A5C1NHY5_9GAMM|nr:deoxyribonuclease V [Halomonas binhaiensis]QEM82480.1 deoxyribonuclease V [Halomonas binhaiensis]
MSTPTTRHLHDWDLAPRDAIALQRRLAGQVERQDRLAGEVKYIAGVDIGFEPSLGTDREVGKRDGITRAAVVVLNWPELNVVEHVVAREPTRMPYIPGLLSFRETPAALAAFAQLKHKVGLVMVDGHGIAHPRRLGVAAHLGLWLDLPTLGVAKKRLTGQHGEVPEERGAWTPLKHDCEMLGIVLRSRAGVKPIFVSPGHRLSIDSARDWAIACLGRYKLPEPTRLADRLASRRDASS